MNIQRNRSGEELTRFERSGGCIYGCGMRWLMGAAVRLRKRQGRYKPYVVHANVDGGVARGAWWHFCLACVWSVKCVLVVWSFILKTNFKKKTHGKSVSSFGTSPYNVHNSNPKGAAPFRWSNKNALLQRMHCTFVMHIRAQFKLQ